MNKLFYEMQTINESIRIKEDFDYFILSSGSDSRAYEILSKIDFTPRSKTKIIIFNYKERLAAKNLFDNIYGYRRFNFPNLQEIECEIRETSSSLEQIEGNLFNEKTKIGIDISCFTKPYFYFLIKLFQERYGVDSIKVYYTEPKSYLFPKGLFDSFRTSSGPLSIIEIPGFPGNETRSSKRKLVILLGFDGDLSKEISIDVGPKETFVINGFPAYSPKFKDISLITNEKLVSDHNINVKYARANNPFEVYNLLASIKNNERNTFMNIAPLGTKPMALGACLFALHNPDVRIVYPMPDQYEEKYSENCWNSWMYQLPLKL